MQIAFFRCININSHTRTLMYTCIHTKVIYIWNFFPVISKNRNKSKVPRRMGEGTTKGQSWITATTSFGMEITQLHCQHHHHLQLLPPTPLTLPHLTRESHSLDLCTTLQRVTVTVGTDTKQMKFVNHSRVFYNYYVFFLLMPYTFYFDFCFCYNVNSFVLIKFHNIFCIYFLAWLKTHTYDNNQFEWYKSIVIFF